MDHEVSAIGICDKVCDLRLCDCEGISNEEDEGEAERNDGCCGNISIFIALDVCSDDGFESLRSVHKPIEDPLEHGPES